jgi:lipid-binding SYLF domain-containing protein
MAAAAAVCLVTFSGVGADVKVRLYAAQPQAQKDDDDKNEPKRVRDAATVFGEIMAAEDKAIPGAILNKASGIAIFPSTIKAGFVVGGMRGRGIISARGSNGWSAPAFLTLTGGSFGLQIGGQAADIILVIGGDRGLQNLVSNQFKIGADAAIAAGPVGRDAQAATDLQLRAQILSYSRARGLFAGVTINGSTIRQDIDANQRFYGSRLTTRQIVFEGKAGSPEPVGLWRETLTKYAK